MGFLTSLVFGDLITLPVDLYYLIYVSVIIGFLTVYVRATRLDLRAFTSRRLALGIVVGVLVGLFLMRGVLARPETARLAGGALWWATFWRGLVYGSVDGLLLFAFPWTVAWRAFAAERGGPERKIGAAAAAWVSILLVTTAYHLGYRDFRSQKIVQPNIGSTIASVATLTAANPMASALSHVFLHVAAVIHSPGTDLYLPPHRE